MGLKRTYPSKLGPNRHLAGMYGGNKASDINPPGHNELCYDQERLEAQEEGHMKAHEAKEYEDAEEKEDSGPVESY